MVVLHLPNEILDIIIRKPLADDENLNENLATLASCRLASHVLCSLATPLFFSSVRLTDSNGRNETDPNVVMRRATKLNEILAIHNMATSVHTLALRCDFQGFLSLKNSIFGLVSGILNFLSHIRKFALEVNGQNYYHFTAIPEDCASSIRALLRSPSLTTLYLDGIQDFPFTAIAASPNLRCLRLWHIPSFLFENTNSTDEISSPHGLQLFLDSLDLQVDACSLYTLIYKGISITRYFSRISSVHLKDLSLNSIRYAWDIMLPASQTLTKLELTVNQNSSRVNTVFWDWGLLLALRHVKIQWGNPYQYRYDVLMNRLTQFLSLSTAPSGIEVLEIGIIWENYKDGDGKYFFSSDISQWSTLDQLLASQSFGCLSKVVLRLNLVKFLFQSHSRDGVRHSLELERRLILPYVNDLFPLCRASTKCTLESHVEVVGHCVHVPVGDNDDYRWVLRKLRLWARFVGLRCV